MPNVPVPAAAPGLPASRRGFLRGLIRLPLIGGGVALIGAPSAVAEPVTDTLLVRYAEWLGRESDLILAELEVRPFRPEEVANIHWRRRWSSAAFQTSPLPLPASPSTLASPASTRAALVLSTIGLDWREGAR